MSSIQEARDMIKEYAIPQCPHGPNCAGCLEMDRRINLLVEAVVARCIENIRDIPTFDKWDVELCAAIAAVRSVRGE